MPLCYTPSLRFEWDDQKARQNQRKHGVAFAEALTCFYDKHQIAFYDPDHGDQEDREVMIAHSSRGRLLFLSYTWRGAAIRIISARKATRQEAVQYAQILRS
jgi:uncharacterized protein